jgi:hypothetical protein
MREPNYVDVSYGPHQRHIMDLYLAESNAPAPLYVFIHPGGFRRGDKSELSPELLEACIAKGISVAAINYRLSGTDPYPAAMEDGVRAVQFLRHNAQECNFDSTQVAAGGAQLEQGSLSGSGSARISPIQPAATQSNANPLASPASPPGRHSHPTIRTSSARLFPGLPMRTRHSSSSSK